ncbi:hypothetical protein PVK06_029710 [Gossypium arboreum]|uniref:Uncharacterized protein n=1 Tax=Gossypium arboreum TaxID=29729 RepID=A0ABR0NLA1_GOSAR|nr:hypothetical protein PVK06_029710 [Gossypium arboreum]
MAETLLGAVLEVVVSKLISIAAEQTSVAWGFQKELKRLRDSLEMIEDFLQDAEEMQTKEKAVKTWLQSLKDVAYEANDVLDEFDYEILRRKVEIQNKIRWKMANEIKDILKSLDNLNKLATDFGLQKRATDPDPAYGRREVETSSVLTGLNIIGRKNDVSKVVDLDIPQNMNALIKILRKKIGQAKRGKEQIKYLLVLDDVWSVEKWDELKNHLMGISKNGGNGVIVTTRIQDVASKVQTLPNQRHQPGRLEDEECWSIIKERAWSIIKERALMASSMSHELDLTLNECSHIRHLNVGCDGEPLPEILTAVAPKVYSLFSEIDVSKKLSKSFTRLRVLKFVCATNICELPDSLGELKHLRYLGISWTSIKTLPKSTTKLYNLQTLRLLGLLRLTFPYGLENLISLKHLYFDRKELQPVNIGNLTCLQTLPIFFVGSERGRSIKELGSLKELRGELKICHLGGSDSGSSGYNSEEVMEGLQPHTNLQSLTVSNYQGESFPSWMLRPVGDSNTGLFLLNNLMELNFFDCINCESLPPLGQLHNLQFLELRNLKKVKRMGNEFYCNEGIDGMNKVIKVFPALKKLTLEKMGSLEEWTAMAATKTFMFPCLEELDICDCPFLKSVPLTGQCSSLKKLRVSSWIPDLEGFSSLQNLSIDSCKELEVLPITGGCSSLEKLRILGCEKLSKIGDGLFSSTCLKELYLCHCSNLSSIPDLEGCFSLKILSINSCNKLEVLPVTGRCSSLEKLSISGCEKLSKIGDGLFTSSLQNLSIDSCNELEVLSLPGRCSSLEKFSIFGCEKLSKIGDGLSACACLNELGLYNCPNLSSIPNLEGFSSLQSLSINRCNELEVLPITGRCSSIEKLRISSCKNISKIGDGLSTSTCLKELYLYLCSNLSLIPDLEGFSSLQNLSIDSCNELEVLPITGRCSSLEKLRISSCKNMTKIGDGLSTSTYLKELDLYLCSNLSWIPDLEGFSSLQNLSIDSCKELASFPLKAPLSSLKKLRIHDCPNLKPIPSLDGLSSLTELEFNKVGEGWSCLLPNMLRSNTSLCSLTILNLPDLIRIPDDSLGRLNCLGKLAIGGFSEELQEFPCLSSFQYLSASLRVLELTGWEKLKSLPPQLQFLSALEELTILEFQGIEAFPEWLGNLSSLRHLYLSGFGKLKSLPHQLQLPTALEDLTMWGFHEIEALPDSFRNLSSLRCLRIWSCNKLMYLPSVDVMGSLSKLETIDIFMCPQLETRCERESGPEWSKISHIPHICINYRMI